jgi:2-polyprenyl-3-methyl-5-hydroxy-6-metoxy-1,4-benzoquinol methylase
MPTKTSLVAPQAPDVQTARQVMEELATSAWALAAVSACAECGLIEQLDHDGRADVLAPACGLPAELVTRLLDVLVALGVVTCRGSRYAASPGAAGANSTFPGIVRAFGRANLIQVHDLYQRGRNRRLDATGWHHTDPDLLHAQGTLSAGFAHGFEHVLLPRLTGLGDRLAAPDAAFLDVGAGVAAITVALCRAFPWLRCVALEPAGAALALARGNVERAGLDARVELRAQRVEELDDVEQFDLVWLPLPFLEPDAVEAALTRTWRALRPGGWALVASVDTSRDDLSSAIARLRCALWGGAPLADDVLGAMLRRAGFTDIRPGAQAPIPMAPTRARKPPASDAHTDG